ncbi:fumarylacetoacetase [Dyadobacter tibetensis]|uniref:fumarylacetoacetase n=1 Tax=Dyadobacter tibetensis TaxID=1211851 RepID=UPI00047131D5|nr:fumarylacetoacetase [Dyadobacter tibetensis]
MKNKRPWLDIPEESDFSLQNLPYGIFCRPSSIPVLGVAIGNYIIDMNMACQKGVFQDFPLDQNVFERSTLNDFIAMGRPYWTYIRTVLQEQLCNRDSTLAQWASLILVKQAEVHMLLPIQVGDYTDFYSSQEHALAVGKLFRPHQPLMPNWKHLPVAYHGRASSIISSHSPVRRPWGQVLSDESAEPIYTPTRELDYELELAFVVGKDSELGQPITSEEAEAYIFGVLLFNDWSARDLQRWEYQPLGPFTSKNFASSISPWVVTLDALEAFRSPPVKQFPKPLEYLEDPTRRGFDIELSVSLRPKNGSWYPLARTNSSYLYWTISQQLAHHTVSGCNLKIGDLLATGTISGPTKGMEGCLLEATAGGKEPVLLDDVHSRHYLEDGDEILIKGYCQGPSGRIGFGNLQTRILPAHT